MKLSILCVTKGEPFAMRFLWEMMQLASGLDAQLVFALDGLGCGNGAMIREMADVCVSVNSKGYLESVLEDALRGCDGEYVLRLDDDERVSPAMWEWLLAGRYEAHEHWKFPRVHLWGNERQVIVDGPLWPDEQTRLSQKHLAGGRGVIHAGSPHGGGALAPVAIEHHKFLVKSFEERQRIAQGYDRVMAGAGTGGFLAFNLPERAYPFLHLGEYCGGWCP